MENFNSRIGCGKIKRADMHWLDGVKARIRNKRVEGVLIASKCLYRVRDSV